MVESERYVTSKDGFYTPEFEERFMEETEALDKTTFVDYFDIMEKAREAEKPNYKKFSVYRLDKQYINAACYLAEQERRALRWIFPD